MGLTIRVASKSTPNAYYQLTVSQDGTDVNCTCGAQGGMCSHIDAVLVANERAMVFPDDLDLADDARKLTEGKIVVPPEWKANWRRNLRWRGLLGAERRPRNPRASGRPLVCFTGDLRPKERKDWIAEAKSNGWDTSDDPSRFTDVLVAADPMANTAKLRKARQYRTPIVTAEEWLAVMTDGVLPN